MIEIRNNTKKLSVIIKNITQKAGKDLRPHIKYLNIADGKIRITDGKILFIMATDKEIENGYYEVVKATQKAIILKDVPQHDYKDFPNVSVITEKEYKSEYRKEGAADLTEMAKFHFPALFAVDTSICLSSFYTNIAFDIGATDCYFLDCENPVKFTGFDFEYYVMPVKN